MFGDIVLKLNLGCRLAVGHLSAASLRPGESESIVAVSHTLDKLVIHKSDARQYLNEDETNWSSPAEQVNYIAVKDVIRCVAISKLLLAGSAQAASLDESRSLILIGCANCINIYDPLNECCSGASIKTKSPVCLLSVSSQASNPIAIATDLQRIYVLRLAASLADPTKVDVDVSCERTTSESTTCIAWGRSHEGELIMTGAKEGNICFYPIDLFDQNLQTCSLLMSESTSVSCLCPIYTSQEVREERPRASDLPVVDKAVHCETYERMSMIAYGLDNGNLGAYQLIKSGPDGKLSSERLWSQRGRQVAQAMLMYDINGDGQDELIIGYASGRIEARSPYSGQLLAATSKCFKSNSERLVGLLALDYFQDARKVLLACSTGSSLVGFRPRQYQPSRLALRDYQDDLASGKQQISLDVCSSFPEAKKGDDLRGKSKETLETRPKLVLTKNKCRARQSGAALEKISHLLREQSELRKKICQSYQAKQQRVNKFRPDDLVIGPSWTIDLAKLALRLTIVVGTSVEEVRLIELEDESKNLLAQGHLFVVPSRSRDAGDNNSANDDVGKSHVLVLPLRPDKDIRTSLLIKVFCGPDKLLCRQLDVPMFSMLAPCNSDSAGSSANRIQLIYSLRSRMDATQTTDWLYENLLCFRLGKLLLLDDDSKDNRHTDLAANPIWDVFEPSTGDFELSLMDIRNRGKALFASKAGKLHLESESLDFLARVVQSLVIDKLKLELSGDDELEKRHQHKLDPATRELDKLVEDAEQLEESEKKIQSELYEACEHTKSLLEQLAIAYDLNEFRTGKELLNELFVMLNVAQSAAKTHCLNNRSRKQFSQQAQLLKTRISLLQGEPRKGRI